MNGSLQGTVQDGHSWNLRAATHRWITVPTAPATLSLRSYVKFHVLGTPQKALYKRSPGKSLEPLRWSCKSWISMNYWSFSFQTLLPQLNWSVARLFFLGQTYCKTTRNTSMESHLMCDYFFLKSKPKIVQFYLGNSFSKLWCPSPCRILKSIGVGYLYKFTVWFWDRAESLRTTD